ncbi:ceramide glucosyltransferase [Aestuariivirga litoralis]|uniref:Ceramide glucosyltransferase n=1 Tax=Aestuariivirga litoralis TaxID=2650924 RepID=A0A2W2AYR3_9HYPH|nr:glycosyltransferase [Aestuariivirga litoralis]PZF78932.1 ceramide glucosyltransferase [Aestuariivirga litoralis]
MSVIGFACLGLATAALAIQIISSVIAMWRCRRNRPAAAPRHRPPITVVRPLCGLEPFSRQTLGSSFAIAYPDYEILFCVADAADPVLPLVRSLLAEHEGRAARLLIGEDAIGANPKLNNMAKGFHQSSHAHVVFVDSNVLTPPDYLDQLVAALEAGAGMVSAPPVGLAPDGFWAELECAFLNSYQARMQYAVDTLGRGFAQGKTLFFRRADLDHGGFAQLASEPAEDAAATRMMRARCQRIRLAGPFPQLVGPRSARQVWKRQVRWARLRRASFPLFFAPEVLAGSLPPLAALLAGLHLLGLAAPLAAPLFLALWYAPELLLLRIAGWPRSIAAILLRDALLPVVFIAGCAGSRFEWHGKAMTAARAPAPAPRFARMHPKLIWARLASRNPFA